MEIYVVEIPSPSLGVARALCSGSTLDYLVWSWSAEDVFRSALQNMLSLVKEFLVLVRDFSQSLKRLDSDHGKEIST
jgi:hypothetical protein